MKQVTLIILMLLIWPLAAAAHDLESLRNQAESDPAALSQLQKLARGHDAKAAFYLGTLYSPLITRKEVTVHKGWPETLHWYRKAAGLGLARADFDLGLAYEEGLGVRKNPQQAKTYFARMAHIARLETALPAAAQVAENPQESARQD
ncbi:sel1 repeat family protein [Acidithiobacillus thiooxidans]|uniref:sel1 repeat family protein n=1 Tax=Acidithiobacillus thiooxidans TaxID=930 RepID=UPI00286147F4|nr:sel1 repeat family protein [Acidithiobacillus thiooxidans]MDR7927027.1 sel1 repeat family protein [Acidithiobacillus thiooxidans]